jgi:hypothetical protein
MEMTKTPETLRFIRLKEAMRLDPTIQTPFTMLAHTPDPNAVALQS